MMLTLFSACLATTVAVLPSQYHSDEFDGAIGELGAKKLLLTYDQFKAGNAFKGLKDVDVVAVSPLFNYCQEIGKLPSNTVATVFGELRDWLKGGGILVLPDACYANGLVNNWLRAVDPELVMPEVKNGCNCEGPAILTADGKAFGPCEIGAGLSWAHLSLPEKGDWTVLAKCGHGVPTAALRRYGRGFVLYTVLRQDYEAYFRNLLRAQFEEKNGRAPTEADGPEFAVKPRLPALPTPKIDVSKPFFGKRIELTVDPENLATMTTMDLLSGTYAFIGELLSENPGKVLVLNALQAPDGDKELAHRVQVINLELARFADGKKVMWCGAGYQREIWNMRSRILNEGYGNNNWWMDRFTGNRRTILASGGKIDLVFLGDSITHNWEGPGAKKLKEMRQEFSILSAGYSGDTVPTLRWRVENGELDGYEAKLVMVMIGTNDAQWRQDRTPKQIADEIRELVKLIRAKQPTAKVLVSSVFPRGEKPDNPYRLRVAEINKNLDGIADGKTVFYTTFAEQFVSPDGTIAKSLMGDFLHPGTKGHEIWASEVMGYFREATGKQPRTAFAKVWKDYPNGWQKKRHEEKLAEIAAAKGKIDLVFAGDSITDFWQTTGSNVLNRIRKDYSVLDIGYAGDTIQELLWRLENGELDGYKAKLFMVMIGTNNTHTDPPCDVALGIKKVVETIAAKQPQAKVLLLPIFPRGNHDDWLRPTVAKINAILPGYADGERVIWVDMYDKFLDSNGDVNHVFPDQVHPNELGYNIWFDAVKPYFRKYGGGDAQN